MGSVVASNVSAPFVFDAHYDPSGLSVADWEPHLVEKVSDRFRAATVLRIRDDNQNGIADSWEELYGLTGTNAAANADPDGDGRTNLQEYNAGTNPTLAENYHASSSVSPAHTVDTWIASTAPNGWSLVEVWGVSGLFMADTAGRAPDTDKDGMPDWFEKLYGLNPNVKDAQLDSDGDGRTNIQEYNAGTNPTLIDDWTKSIAETSEAFETDTRVYYTGGNPTFNVAFAVIKISNRFICDTGGLYYDWDNDGIPNWWEARFSRNGSKTGLKAADDDDADGQSNYNEFIAYTNPTNSNSKFIIGLEQIVVAPVTVQSRTSLSLQAAQSLAETRAAESSFSLRWQSAVGRTYSVFVSTNLTDGWSESPVAEIDGTGAEIEYVPPQGNAAMFFKVSVRLSDNY
ncbi:MAG: hypothetical protein ACI4QD_00490 [Kiritimatiellia bacterium]